MSKPKVAFFDFTSCEGCQLTVVDSLQTHPELLDVVDIVQFREAMTEKGEDYLIAFVEGSLARPADEERLRRIREQAGILVALGACAHIGGINTIRNRQQLEEVRKYVYGDKWEWFDAYESRPISAAVKVDYFIPGCPIDRFEFLEVVKALLQGREPKIKDYPLCVECKLKENVCLYHVGKTCIGPITRAGCDAICPTYGDGCEGCRGLITNPNINAAEDVLKEHGLTVEQVLAKMDLFGTYQMMEMEGVSYD
jgi:coenzyme F420-reducing hydrogenase gamma subunit